VRPIAGSAAPASSSRLLDASVAAGRAAGRGLTTVSQDALVTAVHRFATGGESAAIRDATREAPEGLRQALLQRGVLRHQLPATAAASAISQE
jgi:hypothetical protein